MGYFGDMYRGARREVESTAVKAVVGAALLAVGAITLSESVSSGRTADAELRKYPAYHELLKLDSLSASLTRAHELLTTRTKSFPSSTEYPNPGLARVILERELALVGDLGNVDDQLLSVTLELPQDFGLFMFAGDSLESPRRRIAQAQLEVKSMASAQGRELPKDLMVTRALAPVGSFLGSIGTAVGFMIASWHGIALGDNIRYMRWVRREMQLYETPQAT